VATGKDRAVLRQLRTLWNVGAVRDLTDGQLLERFATTQGETAELAFAVLVERHGPMVLRVCQGVLNDSHDTQDAFQATFLVLVKKARALWVRDSLGPWLHQVAFRTACCARSAAARRHRLERRAAAVNRESRTDAGCELENVLHEEIHRLPAQFQAPLVLCDLEGRTHEQAARHLGWPVGTVKSRQARARERLRDRLRRRGLAPDAGLLIAALRMDGAGALVPPALLDSTIRTVIRSVALRTIAQTTAASLAQEVLKAMATTHWLKIASVLLVAGATVPGARLLAQRGSSAAVARPGNALQAPRAYDGPVFEAKPGKLVVTVTERGSLESSRNADVYCNVEGRTTIIYIVPEGTHVKKGDRICELDSAALRDQLVNQRITTKSAEAAYQNAKLTREVAEIAVIEYKEGIYPQESGALKGALMVAEASVRRAGARLDRTRNARQRLNQAGAADKTRATELLAELEIADRIDAAEQAVEREKMALEQAQTKQHLLQNYTRGKTIKALEVDLERAHSNELAKQATWELEKTKEENLKRQIQVCSILAPADGIVVYANDPIRLGHGQPAIEEGAMVRQRQKILSIPDLTRMQVNVKVHESQIDKVAPGMIAKIRVDALPDRIFSGKVLEVLPLPDANSPNQRVKVYTTKVSIEDPHRALRPGFTADAEILVAERDNVLSVPVDAIHTIDHKDHVAVKKPDGTFEWREVTIGISNDKFVEVRRGINSGELVVTRPLDLIRDGEKHQTAPTPPRKAGDSH
jgi:RND family efflux transporter MFP subunit